MRIVVRLPLRLWRPRPGTHAPPIASCDPPAHSNRHQRRGLEIFLSWHSSILFAREVQEALAFRSVPEATRCHKKRGTIRAKLRATVAQGVRSPFASCSFHVGWSYHEARLIQCRRTRAHT